MTLLCSLSLLLAPSLLIAQPISSTDTIETKEAQSQKVGLSPPINVPLRLNKTQIHHIGDKQFALHLVKDMVFKPRSDDMFIGYDISVEIIDIKIEGDSKIIGLLANAHPTVGSISQYSYDEANERLTLHNSDKIWIGMMASIDKIIQNAEARSQAQRIEDKKLVDAIQNIPPRSRTAILSQDMALLLSFIGKIIPTNDADEMLVKVTQSHDRQNGLIAETSDFYVSHQTGLVHKLTRINQSQGDKKRKIVTEIEVKLP